MPKRPKCFVRTCCGEVLVIRCEAEAVQLQQKCARIQGSFLLQQGLMEYVAIMVDCTSLEHLGDGHGHIGTHHRLLSKAVNCTAFQQIMTEIVARSRESYPDQRVLLLLMGQAQISGCFHPCLDRST